MEQRPPNESAPASGSAPPELDELAGQADQLDGAAPPESAAPPAPAPAVPTGEVLGGMLFTLFEVLAPNWSVTEKESRQLGDAWALVFDKYGGLSRFGPEIGAALVTFAILGPRIAARKPPKMISGDDAPEPAAA